MKKLCIMLAVVLAFGFAFTGCDIGFLDSPYEPPVEPSFQDQPPFLDYFVTVSNDVAELQDYFPETSFPARYPIGVYISGTTRTNDVPKYVITLKSGGTVVDSIAGSFDNPIAKEAGFYQILSINSIDTTGSFIAEVYLEDTKGNKSNTLTTTFTVFDGGYITVWPNPQVKQIEVVEGIKTVALLATGNYCDIYFDITVSQPTESQLIQIVFKYDNDYERVTSFLGLYELGGGPGGDGGGDGNPRIQTYIYVLEGAGGRAYYFNDESVHLGIGNVLNDRSTFTHELCHLIFFGNHYSPPYYFGAPDYPPYPNNWYVEFLSIMAEVVFYDYYVYRALPKELFVDWEIGSPDADYGTYRLLSKFLLEKYGDTIFYDLLHDAAVNKEALENVLRKRDSTISAMEVEFTAWCDSVNAMIAI